MFTGILWGHPSIYIPHCHTQAANAIVLNEIMAVLASLDHLIPLYPRRRKVMSIRTITITIHPIRHTVPLSHSLKVIIASSPAIHESYVVYFLVLVLWEEKVMHRHLQNKIPFILDYPN